MIVLDFLGAFQSGRHQDLEPFLAEDVVYRMEGFAPVTGRSAVLAFWRRMFDVHSAVRMSPSRQMRDGDLVLVSQSQHYRAPGRPPLLLESMAIFELQAERIRSWCDCLRPGGVDEAHAEVWRRLRNARW